MYQIQVYSIAPDLWRWEVRRGHTLLSCGTTHTRQSAEREAKQVSAA